MSNNAPRPANAISARILCGEPKGAEAVPFSSPLTEGKRYANVRIPSSDCRWHWLSIDVALPDDAMGVDIVLSGLSLPTALCSLQISVGFRKKIGRASWRERVCQDV